MIQSVKDKHYIATLLGGAIAISQSSLTMAQNTPPVMEGLPPAPPVQRLTAPPQVKDPFAPSNQNLPSLPPQPSTNINSANYDRTFTAPSSSSNSKPNPPVTSNNSSGLYRVDVDGDTQWMLAKVKTLEPQAFIRKEDRVIQAGLFREKENAQNLVRQLEQQGFRARTIAVDKSELAFNPSSKNRQHRGYFISIPSSRRNLSTVTDKVSRAGLERSIIQSKRTPRGLHVAVGPFGSWTEANRWNSYFRSEGLDARIYFDR
jgi:hypothetical protein